MTVDLLPNGLFHYLPFFFAGALFGTSSGMAEDAERKRKRRRKRRRREREALERGDDPNGPLEGAGAEAP
jgi:hypothetical protein